MKYLVSSLVIIIVFLVVGLSYYIGKSSNNSLQNAATATGYPAKSSPTITPTQTPTPGKKITGGGILSFPKYEITIPQDWTNSRQTQSKDDEKIILTKEGYQITIMEGAFGGAVCLFPGDADVEGPSARYDNFQEIKTQDGNQFRRAWTGTELNSKGFAICQNTQYGWEAPTLFGHISFTTPTSPTKEMLVEMDSILASITKI